MKTYFNESENTLTCRFTGRLTTEISSEIFMELTKKIDELKSGHNIQDELKIVFDMEEVDYLSSSFLRACFMASKNTGKNYFSIINTT